MKQSLNNINELNTQIQALLPMKPEWQKKLDEKFRLEFNFNSNHMEGNTLTYGETKLLILFDQTTGNHTLREYEEMKAHDVALKLVTEWANEPERPLTESAIKQLNEIILVRPFWKDAITPDGQPTRRQIQVGDYKQHPNHVKLENGEFFEYASVTDTPILMGDLVAWYHEQEREQQHPVFIAAMLHYKFVRIHPFDDGNGRVARLIMNYVLLRHGLPPVVIKSAEKKAYLAALNRADADDLEAFVDYIANQMAWSLEIALKAARGESVEEAGDLDKRIALLEKKLKASDPEKEIKTIFSGAVFEKIFDTWISDLILEVVPVIQKFNRFFTDPTHLISLPGGLSGQGFSVEPAKEIIEKLRVYSRQNPNFYLSEAPFSIQAFYGSFKQANPELSSFGCDYKLEIKFDKIRYTVKIDLPSGPEPGPRQQEEMFKRLLHQPLTQSEVSAVAQKFATTIIEHIERNARHI